MERRKDESLEAFRERDAAYKRQWRANKRVINSQTGQETTTYVLEREPYSPLDGASLSRRSSLVDAEGNVIQTWRIEKPDDTARWEKLQAAVEAFKQDLPRAPVIPFPQCAPDEGRLTGYPIGDHHMGMLAWWREVGVSYDLDIGEQILGAAIDHLVDRSPPSKYALVAGLGDFFHYDSMEAMTPKHGHILDQDSRAGKMVHAGCRVFRRVIERAAEKHEVVQVIFESGNHDPFSALWMKELLAVKYEDNPRITIDTSPSAFHKYRFGKNLIATHHGDTVKKLGDLPGIMAADWPQDWADTTHRVWWTGHTHSQEWLTFNGCNVEVFPILAPADAYAHMLGHHKKERKMQAIVFDAEDGEVERYTFRPEMVK